MALREYFESRPLDTPLVVDGSELGDEEDDVGYVTLSEGIGALLVKDADGQDWRLSWEGDEPGADRRRGLPPGSYDVTGYRMIDRSREGEEWHISVTGVRHWKLEVDTGETLEVEVDATVHMRSGMRGKRATMSIVGMHGAGLSIYKDGRRIPINFRVTDSEGEVLAKGPMNYG